MAFGVLADVTLLKIHAKTVTLLRFTCLRSAMYKGDSRTRAIDIYVDGIMATSWTSSGNTLSFETVDLGVVGKTIELRGVLDDSEWLSIMEVRTGAVSFSV